MALSDKQLNALNLMIYEGKLKKEAAEAVGVAPETLSRWFYNQEFVKTYQEMREKLLVEASHKALQKMIGLMTDAQSESVQFNAAKDILSRAGMDAITKQEITQKTITIGVEEDSTEDKTLDSEDGGPQNDREEGRSI